MQEGKERSPSEEGKGQCRVGAVPQGEATALVSECHRPSGLGGGAGRWGRGEVDSVTTASDPDGRLETALGAGALRMVKEQRRDGKWKRQGPAESPERKCLSHAEGMPPGPSRPPPNAPPSCLWALLETCANSRLSRKTVTGITDTGWILHVEIVVLLLLAVPCGLWDLSSPIQDLTRVPCSRSAES